MKNFIQRVDSFLALLKFKDSDNIKKYSHNIISYVETLDNLGDQEPVNYFV